MAATPTGPLRALPDTKGQQPDDVVGTVVFLAGPGAEFMTGQSLLVNGGSRFN